MSSYARPPACATLGASFAPPARTASPAFDRELSLLIDQVVVHLERPNLSLAELVALRLAKAAFERAAGLVSLEGPGARFTPLVERCAS